MELLKNEIMPHVSKEKVSRKIQKKISTSFVNLMTKIDDKGSEEFISEFFTGTEKLMFAKRLAIIAMLDKKVSRYKISQELKVSKSTVKRLYLNLIKGDYEHIQSVLRDKALRKTLLDHLEAIIQPKFMPGVGKDRWRWLHEMYDGPQNELKKKGYFKG